MAEKEAIILEIDVNSEDASKALADVTKRIDELNAKRKETKTLTADEEQELKRLQREQKNLTTVIGSQKGSYDQLSAAYSRNKSVLNAMSNEQRYNTEEGKKLEAETKALYAQMNEMQKATGKYTLQVGNYRIALNDLKGTIKETATGFLDMAKAVIANPIGAIIAAVAGAFMLMKKALESSVAGQEKLARITGTLKGALNGLVEVLVQAGELLFSLFTGDWKGVAKNAKDIKDAFLNIGNVASATGKIEEAEQKLRKAMSDWSRERSDLEKRRSELEVIAKDTMADSNKRLKATQEIEKINDTIQERERANIVKQIKLLEEKQSLTSNTIEDNEELNALYVELNRIDIERNQRQAELNEKKNSALNSIKSQKKETQDLAKIEKESYDAEIRRLNSELALTEEYSVEAYNLQAKMYEMDRDNAIKNGTDKVTAYNEYMKNMDDLDAKYNKKKDDDEMTRNEERKKMMEQYEKDLNDARIEIVKGDIDATAELKKEALKKEYDDAIANAEKIGADTAKITQSYNEQIKQIDIEAADAKIGIAQSMVGNITDALGSLFEENKGVQIASTVASTIADAAATYSKTLAQGGAFATPLAITSAASVVARGFSAIQKLSSTNKNSKSVAGGSSISRTTSSVNDTIVQRTAGNIVGKSETPQPVLVVDEVTAKQMQISQAQKLAVQ